MARHQFGSSPEIHMHRYNRYKKRLVHRVRDVIKNSRVGACSTAFTLLIDAAYMMGSAHESTRSVDKLDPRWGREEVIEGRKAIVLSRLLDSATNEYMKHCRRK